MNIALTARPPITCPACAIWAPRAQHPKYRRSAAAVSRYNIAADFQTPVFAVSAGVSGVAGHAISMIAKDAFGNVLDTDTSLAIPELGTFLPLRVESILPIASVEWWSLGNQPLRVDNIAVTVPEPGSATMLAIAGALLARHLPRRRRLH